MTDLEDRSLDELIAPETVLGSETTPMYVTMFEGAVVAEMEARLPAMTLALEESYTRGTHLRFEIEFRVKDVRHNENRDGDLVRHHALALETVTLRAAFQPEDRNEPVGGSAGSHPKQTEQEIADLGVEFRRSSETWGAGF